MERASASSVFYQPILTGDVVGAYRAWMDYDGVPSEPLRTDQEQSVARAKKTARADARRKYRIEQGLPLEIDGEDDAATPSSGTGAATRSASAPGAPQRLSIGAAFKQSFTPLDIRGDLAALPWIATRTKALWLPALITVGATAAFYVTQGSDIVTRFLFAYFIQTPAIGGVFLAGFLAPRASWLLGVIIGLLSAVCYTFLILTVFSAVASASPTPGVTQDVILSAFVMSPIMGAIFASAAAWYRRFLSLSNPNRGRKPPPKAQGRPDGKSRTTSQKAPVRR
jgi:hypothetical protein